MLELPPHSQRPLADAGCVIWGHARPCRWASTMVGWMPHATHALRLRVRSTTYSR